MTKTKVTRRPDRASGGITSEEKALMDEHAKMWIARALRTGPTDDEALTQAILALYRAANLPAPRVVIVPSPLVMAVASGFASAIIYARKTGTGARSATSDAAERAATDTAANSITRTATHDVAEDATHDATDASTRAPTRASTRAAADASARAANDATFNATVAAALDSAAAAGRDATLNATAHATYFAVDTETHAATDHVTRDAVLAATYIAADDATRDVARATEDAADRVTEAVTDATANAITMYYDTVAAVHDATDAVTRAETHVAAHAVTYAATHIAYATYDATRAAAGDVARGATDRVAKAAAFDATRSVTEAFTEAAMRADTQSATDVATRDTMRNATDGVVWSATFADDATYRATVAAAKTATHDEGTRDATGDAMRTNMYSDVVAATDNATRAEAYAATATVACAETHTATQTVTYAATIAAAHDIARDATRGWARRLAEQIDPSLADLMLACVPRWSSSYQGGNMWAAWECYLTAARDILGLRLSSHEAYSAWEQAAIHGGFRVVRREFAMVCRFPEVLRIDEQSLPHCADGPSHRWQDGFEIYSWHGVQVPRDWIMSPQTMDAHAVLAEENAELRRAGIEIMGWTRVLKETGACAIDTDIDPEIGALLEADLDRYENRR